MAYQLAISHSEIFAAVVPVEGSVHTGFYETISNSKSVPISVLDIHGTQDTTIPSNKTLSYDFWRYETT